MRRPILVALLLCVPSVALAIDYNPVTFGTANTGNTKYETDCSTTISTGTVVCANAAFAAGDVGKTIWCIDATGANPLLALTTIASRSSATTVVATGHAIGSSGAAWCAWGTTDDTPAIVAAVAAATSTAVAGGIYGGAFLVPAGRVVFPCGGFQISARILNVQTNTVTVPDIVGGGPSCTVLILRPDFVIPGDGTGALMQVTGSGFTLKDFAIQGMTDPFAWNVDQDLIRLTQVSRVVVENVSAVNLFAVQNGGSMSVLSLRGASRGTLRNLFIQGGDPEALGQMAAQSALKLVTVGDVAIFNSLFSNFANNVSISASHGRTPTSAGINFFGGLIDECWLPGGCLALHDAEVNLNGVTVFGNQSSVPISLDATSELWVSDSNIGSFNAIGDVSPASITAGAFVISRGTTWRNNGAATILNNGFFLDAMGNSFLSCSGSACSPITEPAAFGSSVGTVRQALTWP